MLRHHYLMPTQLFAAHRLFLNYLTEVDLPLQSASNIQSALFGRFPLEFLGAVPSRTAPHAHNLSDQAAVYQDDAGLLYYPHRDSDYTPDTDEYDTMLFVPPQFADIWVCKIPQQAVHAYRTMDTPQETVQLPSLYAELALTRRTTSRHKQILSCEVSAVLEKYDGCCVLKFSDPIPTEQDGEADAAAVFASLSAALLQQ